MWSRSKTAIATGVSPRRARASSRGSSSSYTRRVTRPVKESVSASAATRARRPACSMAIAAWEATSFSTTAGGLGQRVQRPLPDDDQHAADLAVAQDRLEDGGTRAGRLDQRRGQRRVVAGVGDEVRLLRGEGLAGAGTVATRLDRHRLDLHARHRRRGEIAAGGLQQERDGRVHDLAGGLADRLARVVTCGECLGHTADRTHSLGLISKHVVEPTEVACVGFPFKLARQHAGEHDEQLFVGR